MNKYLKFFGISLIILLAFFAVSIRNVSAATNTVTTGDANSFSCTVTLVNTDVNYLSWLNWFNLNCGAPTPTCNDDKSCVTPTPSPTPTPSQPPSNNNGGGSSSGGGGSTTNPPSCGNQKPNQPYNLLATAGPGTGQVTLTWGPPSGSVSDYSITYSDDPSTQKWGVASTGNVTKYIISGLSVNKYYFRVNAINGCMSGDPIGPVSVGGTGGPQVLGLSTTSGEGNYLLLFVQLFGALSLAGLGFVFFKKNG
ncbi:MAG: fibronectin type III domain-containing protein [Candidatus Levyibacteriota bacterium]|jgi:hypothetical protein